METSPTTEKVPGTFWYQRYHSFYFLGLGRYFAWGWMDDPQKVTDYINSLNNNEREWFYKGIAKEISFVEDPWIRKELMKALSRFFGC